MTVLKNAKCLERLKVYLSFCRLEFVKSFGILVVPCFEEGESKRLYLVIILKIKEVRDGDCDWFGEPEVWVIPNTDPEHR